MTNKEIDKWIAENVMGWKRDIHNDCWLTVEPKPFPIAWWNPTKSISDAFQVVLKMTKDDTQVEMGNNYSGDDWYCFFGLGTEPIPNADTLPLAICLAAKKAFEANKEDKP